MEKIAVSIITYNEEERISIVLKSVAKFDFVLVIDKSSTDRTREIAESMGAKVIQVPYTDNDPEYNRVVAAEELKKQGFKWRLGLTCSDVCHKDLYDAISKAVNDYAKNADAVQIPYIQYSMGLTGKNTYYNKSKTKPSLVKIDSLQYSTEVHGFGIKTDAIYASLMITDKKIAVYHLTHETLDNIMERHIRYAKNIAVTRWNSGRTKERELRSCTIAVIRHVLDYVKLGIFKKKWDGLAQFFMLLMYYSMIYLFTYFDEKKSAEIIEQYDELRESLLGKSYEHKKQTKEDKNN